MELESNSLADSARGSSARRGRTSYFQFRFWTENCILRISVQILNWKLHFGDFSSDSELKIGYLEFSVQILNWKLYSINFISYYKYFSIKFFFQIYSENVGCSLLGCRQTWMYPLPWQPKWLWHLQESKFPGAAIAWAPGMVEMEPSQGQEARLNQLGDQCIKKYADVPHAVLPIVSRSIFLCKGFGRNRMPSRKVAGYIGQAFRMLEKEQPFTICALLACSEETPLHSTQCSQHQVLKAPNAKSTTHVIWYCGQPCASRTENAFRVAIYFSFKEFMPCILFICILFPFSPFFIQNFSCFSQLMAMDSRPEKIRKLQHLRKAIPYTSKTALEAIFKHVKDEGLPELVDRKAMREANRAIIHQCSGDRPLLQTAELTTHDEKTLEVKFTGSDIRNIQDCFCAQKHNNSTECFNIYSTECFLYTRWSHKS